MVTGGAGFIGGALVSAAIERGDEVVVFDSLRPDVHGAAPAIDPRVTFVRGDVREISAADLDGIELVYHQAAKVGLGIDFSDSADYVSSNDLGTAVLLNAMAQAKVARLVLASSMVVYGDGAYDGVPLPRSIADLRAGEFDPVDASGRTLVAGLVDETAPADPRNVYAASKLAQEHLAAAWTRSTGGVAAALRYHNVYGPNMPQNTPYAGVASLFRSAIERGEAPRVFEDGGQRRDFVHVGDVARANLAAADWSAAASAGSFRAFNVGSGVVHTIGELAQQLSDNAGGLPPEVTGEFRLGDVRHITASSARAAAELGWIASVGFEQGMREFASAPLRAAVKPST